MKKSMFIKKIILFIALISFILSCNNSQNYNHNINANNKRYSDTIYEDIIYEDTIYEDTIYEDIIYEDIIYEDIIYEDTIYEDIIEEIIIFENTLYEDIIIEDVNMEFTSIKDFNDNFDNCFSSDALIYDIDWAGVLSKFSIGTAVIIGTGVISFTSAAMGQTQLAFVFATSSKEALREALIGAAIGGALNTVVEAIKSGGVIEESALKYAIEGAADGFMWGAISGAALGLYKGFKILAKNPILDSSGKLIGIPDEFGNLVDDYGKIKGTILDNDFIADNNNRIIGKLDDSGNFTRNYKSYIPDATKSKNLGLEIKGKSVYRISNGKEIGEYIGEIDDAGRIIKDRELIAQIDKNGRIMSSIQESVDKGVKLAPDRTVLNLGDFKIEPSRKKGIRNVYDESRKLIGRIDDNNKLIYNWNGNLIYTKDNKLRWIIEEGNKVFHFNNGKYIGEIDDARRIIKDGNLIAKIDENNKIMPSIRQSVDKGVKLSPDGTVLNLGDFKIEKSTEEGIRNIKDSKGLIAGQIDENGKLIDNWREKLTKARIEGRDRAIDCIIKNNLSYAEAINRRVIDDKSVSKSLYEKFLKTGKGLVGHHIKSVASNPNYANRPDNFIFLTPDAHLKKHGGNFHNQTKGNFTKLKCK